MASRDPTQGKRPELAATRLLHQLSLAGISGTRGRVPVGPLRPFPTSTDCGITEGDREGGNQPPHTASQTPAGSAPLPGRGLRCPAPGQAPEGFLSRRRPPRLPETWPRPRHGAIGLCLMPSPTPRSSCVSTRLCRTRSEGLSPPGLQVHPDSDISSGWESPGPPSPGPARNGHSEVP